MRRAAHNAFTTRVSMWVGGESRTFCVSEAAANAAADVFMLTTSEKMNSSSTNSIMYARK